MRCDEIQERFLDLLYHEGGAETASPELRAHLSSCPRCRRELDGLEQVRDTLKQWPDESPQRPILLPAAKRSQPRRRLMPWRLLRYGAVAALLVLAFLALANAEISWNNQGFTFRTQLVSRKPSGPEYYTKAEMREMLKRVLDDSESRMIEANYEMIQRMMDTLDQERWQDLRLVRGNSLTNSSKN
jgi:predicted anti-sigma-YlaC factor YlaD